MSIAYVQGFSNGYNFTGASGTAAGGISAPTPGNTLFVVAASYGDVGQTCSVTQTGATYTLIASASGTSQNVQLFLFSATNIGSDVSTSVTVNNSDSACYTTFWCYEYSGFGATPAASIVDQTASNSFSFTTSPSSGTTSTTSVANELWFALVVAFGSPGVTYSSPTNGYSILGQGYVASKRNACVCAQIVNSTGAAGCSVTSSPACSGIGLSVALMAQSSTGEFKGSLCSLGIGD